MEQYIYTNDNDDINKIIGIFGRYVIRGAGDLCGECREKLTLSEGIQLEEQDYLEEGTQLLHFVGETGCLENVESIFGMQAEEQKFSREEEEVIEKVRIIRFDPEALQKIRKTAQIEKLRIESF